MTYLEWIDCFAALTSRRREDLSRKLRALAHQPLISIILPVYNGALKYLDEAIGSVRRQIYSNWELCIADDASTDPRIKPFLEDLAGGESRIRLHFRESNGHISACSNTALSLARGEWCGLLDQDDALAEDALAEVALEISEHPASTIIYSDEDFLDANGVRSNPFFKPDWNPELFLAQNYLNHLGVYRTALVREVGGFREGFEGSQDYDLALRCLARSKPEQIRHLSRLLYHWRMVEGSLADEPGAKPYARHAARRALNDYLVEGGIAARAEPCPQNAESHRIIYRAPQPLPKVTLMTRRAQSAKVFARSEYPALEIIRAQTGEAWDLNAAAAEAKGDVLIFLNHAIEATEPGWLEEMVSLVVRPEVGAVGARLWSRQGTLEDGGLILGLGGIAAPAFRGLPREHPGYFNRAWLQQNYSAVSAACLAVRQEVFRALGGFDAQNLPQHFYDVDLCLRLAAQGRRIVWTPYACLVLGDPDVGKETDSSLEADYMHRRWGRQLARDPFYNPNLSLQPPGFMVAIPPRA